MVAALKLDQCFADTLGFAWAPKFAGKERSQQHSVPPRSTMCYPLHEAPNPQCADAGQPEGPQSRECEFGSSWNLRSGGFGEALNPCVDSKDFIKSRATLLWGKIKNIFLGALEAHRAPGPSALIEGLPARGGRPCRAGRQQGVRGLRRGSRGTRPRKWR